MKLSLIRVLQALKLKSFKLECHSKQVTADDHQNKSARGAFIAGINSHKIRERLLEKFNLIFDKVFNLAISLEDAERNMQAFGNTSTPLNLNALPESLFNRIKDDDDACFVVEILTNELNILLSMKIVKSV